MTLLNVTLLDTSIATDNLGDEIIMDAVQQVVSEVLPRANVYRVATHEYMSWVSRRLLRKSTLAIVGGTNLLSSSMGRFSLWKVMPWDVPSLNRAILLGAGWRSYMGEMDAYTRWMLKRILCSNSIHSVRDTYSKKKLASLDKKVCDTGCPTMWPLIPSHCKAIPHRRADEVVTTLTYYLPNPQRDHAFLNLLKRSYRKVYFWSQQSEDQAYLDSLKVPGITSIYPTVGSYNALLDSHPIDFVGTRLHGGIRALQKGRRSLILAVDNRATEIAQSCNLPVAPREATEEIEAWIFGEAPTSVRLPFEAIADWKAQFREYATSS